MAFRYLQSHNLASAGQQCLVGALYNWELFTRLRDLGKPVELYFIPDVENGEHVLESPRQQMASQGASVDWFDFWLNGREDPSDAKKEQYARWRQLRELQHATLTSRVGADASAELRSDCAPSLCPNP